MRILIDTNVMLDFLTMRESYFADSDRIMDLCKTDDVVACIATHSVMNTFYILRKDYSIEQRRQMLLRYMRLVSIVGINKKQIVDALNRADFKDVEDCLQDECALGFNADYIVTRNVTDYSHSKVKAVTPREFLGLIQQLK